MSSTTISWINIEIFKIYENNSYYSKIEKVKLNLLKYLTNCK